MLSLLVLVNCSHLIVAKEWRGLSPLKSNRADVERRLGQPDEKMGDNRVLYYFPEFVISIEFSANPQCEAKMPQGSWNVPSGTVTTIRLDTRYQPRLSDLKFDLSKFTKRRVAADMIGHYYYTNEEEGYTLEVSGDFVMSYINEASAKDQHLRCPGTATSLSSNL
jgi:hypothetical protein